jgi:hypothetical protein
LNAQKISRRDRLLQQPQKQAQFANLLDVAAARFVCAAGLPL